MKGIIGIVGKINSDVPGRMGKTLSHRGDVVRRDGNGFALGQISDLGVEPFQQQGITVISDARIDNIEELAERLDIPVPEPHISNNEFIFNCYFNAGIGFTEWLTGDFSIVIVDENKEKVFLVRDHLGIRPLYYCFKSGFMAVASEPKALLCLNEVSPALNQRKIDEYLQWPTDLRTYENETFYRDILSVLPATYLTTDLRASAVKETFYWKINHERFAHLTNEEQIIQEYRRTFERAVKRRLKNKNGFHLSGGLDSSSVYKMAEKLMMGPENLYPVHFYPDHPKADEREYAHDVVRDNPKNYKEIKRTSTPVTDFRLVHTFMDRPDPSTIPTAIKILPELKHFQAMGAKVVFTGHEGDTVVDAGHFYLQNLFKTLRIKEFEEIFQGNANKLMEVRRKMFIRVLNEKYRNGGYLSTLSFFISAIWKGGVSPTDFKNIFTLFLKKTIKRTRQTARIKQAPFPSGARYVPEGLSEAVSEHFSRITCAGIVELTEKLNLTGAAFGIEYVHPFLDKDFVELSLFVPEKMRFGPEGLSRYHFRKSMEGILPEKIRLRDWKVSFDEPIRLTILDAITAYAETEACSPSMKTKWIEIRHRLSKSKDGQPVHFRGIKTAHRLWLFELWKTYIGNKYL